MKGWMDGGDADANSIPDTCQETTRGPREELQRRQSQPLQPGKHRAGCQPCCTCPAPHCTAGKTPAGQQQPHHHCQHRSIHHLFNPSFFFFPLFKIISLCLSLFCWSKIDTAAHNKPPWAVSDVSSKGKYRKMS